MARIAKTTAVATTNATNPKQDNPFVDKKIKGYLTLDKVVRKINTNGTEFVSTSFGSIYLRQQEIVENKEYTVVEFSNGALALNSVDPTEKLAFYSAKFPNSTLTEIANLFNIKIG